MNKLFYYSQVISVFLDTSFDEHWLLSLLDEYIEAWAQIEDKDEDDDYCLNLQDFIGSNLSEKFQWMTALSIIEIADNAVLSAIENGNIITE